MEANWLWRPNKLVDHRPESEDYRCCCGGCKVENCFKFVILLNILSLVLGFYGLVFGDGNGMNWGRLLIGVFVVTMGVLAINTLKPVYMQIYWLIQIFYVIFVNLAQILLIVLAFLVYFAMDPAKPQHEKEHMLWIAIVLSISYVLIFLPISLWILSFVYQFYCYIRDRQLWNEQEDATNPIINA